MLPLIINIHITWPNLPPGGKETEEIFLYIIIILVDLIDLERLQIDSTSTRMQCWTMFSTAGHTQVSEICAMEHLVSALLAFQSVTTVTICTALNLPTIHIIICYRLLTLSLFLIPFLI